MHPHRLLFCKAYAVLCDFLRQSSLHLCRICGHGVCACCQNLHMQQAKPLQRGGQWQLGVAVCPACVARKFWRVPALQIFGGKMRGYG